MVYRPRPSDNSDVPAYDRLTRALGTALRERRESLGSAATQEEIAHKARITVRHLQKLEKGQTNPKLETLLAVGRALKTNVQSLLDRAEELLPRRER